ncbi:MAG: four helix bundle protein [Lentisphaeria bacterium]|nr:four helix bundle protein [Lentisphaeria bacterium]
MQKSSNKLADISVAFAVEILKLVQLLKSRHETIICNQIGRAGTSIGANIHEAQAVQVHGFHVDIPAKEMRLDVVMSFGIRPKEGVEILRKEIGQAYPDYAVLIIPDVDVSD